MPDRLPGTAIRRPPASGDSWPRPTSPGPCDRACMSHRLLRQFDDRNRADSESVEHAVTYRRAFLALSMLLLAVGCTSTSEANTGPSPVALSCPRHIPASVPRHQRPGTAAQVVPGRPVALLACRYYGLNLPQPMGTLARSAHMAPAPVAAALNRQPSVDPDAYFCPRDSGATILLDFAYADDSHLLVRVSVQGCQFATNGDRTVRAAGVVGPLQELLGHDSS